MLVKKYSKSFLVVMLMSVMSIGSFLVNTTLANNKNVLREHEYAKITRQRVEAATKPGATKAEIKLAEGSLTALGWFIIYGNGSDSFNLANTLAQKVADTYNGTDKMDVIYMKHTSDAYFEMLNLKRFNSQKPDNPSDEYSRLTKQRVEAALVAGAAHNEFKLAEGSLCALGWLTLYGNDSNSDKLARTMMNLAYNHWKGANEVYMLQSSTAYAEMINLGRFKLNQTAPQNTPTAKVPGSAVEDQYWDAVKNSTNAADFQSYLNEYPNGKYAAIARLKVNGGGGRPISNTPTRTNPNQAKIPVSAKLTIQSDRIPVSYNDSAYTVQKLDKNPAIYLSVTFSDGTITDNYEYHRGFAQNVIFDDVSGDPNNIIQINWWDVDSKNPGLGKFAGQLTSTGNGVGTAYLKVSFRNAPNVTASVPVTVVSGNTGTATRKTDAEYLNSRAAEVKMSLPSMVGDFQMTNAWSRCPVGCQEKESSAYLLLMFNAQNNQQNMPIEQIKQSLKPLLLQQYCKSETVQRNLILGVFFSNRGQYADYNNFWIYPKDCP